MRGTGEVRLEAATGISRGRRAMQEDAVLCDVPQGGAAGIVVLADGLGGHAGGAVASRLAVTTALRELAGHRDAEGALSGHIPGLLRVAAEAANHAVLAQAELAPEVEGMGTTLLGAVVQGGDLYWVSVGDSPLFLLRAGRLRQLNETHSLATHLDLLVEVGEMTPEAAAAHPGRACLTSALGSEPIERIDCPDAPLRLRPGDVILAASDGLLTLAPGEIGAIADARDERSADLASRLLEAVARAGEAEQDNVSLAVLRAEPVAPRAAPRAGFGLRGALARLLDGLRGGHAPGSALPQGGLRGSGLRGSGLRGSGAAAGGLSSAARSALEVQE